MNMRRVAFALLALSACTQQAASQGSTNDAEIILMKELREYVDRKPKLPPSTWKTLYEFAPPRTVRDQVRSQGKGWVVHALDDNDLNGPACLDYYSIRVKSMPKESNGKSWSDEALFSEFVKRLFQRKERALSTNIVRFVPQKSESQWTKREIGAIAYLEFLSVSLEELHPKIAALMCCEDLEWLQKTQACRAMCSLTKQTVSVDDGCIVLSEAGPKMVRVSTIRGGRSRSWSAGVEPKVAGAHPVSGNREWGISKADDGGTVLYTMGFDRVNTIAGYELPVPFAAAAFFGQELFWRMWMQEFIDFVKESGGEAEWGKRTSGRVAWTTIKSPTAWQAKAW